MSESLDVPRRTKARGPIGKEKREAVALALAQGKTWDAVCKELSTSKDTIAKLTRDPEFQKRIEEHHDAIIEDARRYLRRNALNAAQKVVQIMESGYPQHSLRLAAAKDVLDRAGVKVPEKNDGNSAVQPNITIQVAAIDYRAAIAALAPPADGSVVDLDPSGEGEGAGDGPALGEVHNGRRLLPGDGESGR